jgi:pimeloyl-ACP methyl ester carboxylesterase
MDGDGNMKNKDLPVMIYLHEYDYSKGFNSLKQIESFFQLIVKKGYAVFSFDMLGFGNRIEEGTRFYQRYPHWSKMGKMVADVKGAVDALTNLDFVNSDHIIVAGYSLGATVGLYSAAMDDRIAGVISVAGFTPMRTNTLDRGTEGIMTYSHLHGLIPRLGFFVNNESRIPYDFHDVLACIAPRPIFVIAPKFDKDAHDEDIFKCVNEVKKIYKIFDLQDKIQIHSPEDINRLSPEMKMEMVEWIN